MAGVGQPARVAGKGMGGYGYGLHFRNLCPTRTREAGWRVGLGLRNPIWQVHSLPERLLVRDIASIASRLYSNSLLVDE